MFGFEEGLLNLVKTKGIFQNKFLETWLLGGHSGIKNYMMG